MKLQKGAMFGKLSQLESINLKQAAMFGLDARIALAIFGALSVISGAALYSAIQDAKATALLNDMVEVGKAFDAYLLDTGAELGRYETSDTTDFRYYVFKANALVENVDNVAGWNGPYYSGYKELDTDVNGLVSLKRNDGVLIFLGLHTKSENWGDDTDWVNDYCTAGKKCVINVQFALFKNLSIVKKIDEKVDGSDGPKKGRFKWYEHSANNYYLFYEHTPYRNL